MRGEGPSRDRSHPRGRCRFPGLPGTERETETIGKTVVASDAGAVIGGSRTKDDHAIGLIDDVRVWKRVLTDDEIASLAAR